MSLLNLNSPAGQSPRGKKGLKMWMGAGLVVAVLGIGSTFAANMNINGNVDSEFGQGSTKTVYCGETKADIIVAPVSKFVNEYTIAGRAGVPSSWIAPTWTGTPTFQEVDTSPSKYSFTAPYVNDLSGASSSVKGYWIQTNRSSSSVFQGSTAPTSGYVFAPQAVGNSSTQWASRSSSPTTSGSQKYGYWKFQSWTPGSMSIAIQSIAPKNVASDFVLTGITVSNIDEECIGRNFVLSAYGDSATAVALVTDYKEVAVLYEAEDTETFSFSRSSKDVPSNKNTLAEVVGGAKQFTITFKEGSGRISTGLFKNIVVETQEDLLSSASVGRNDDDDDRD